MAKRTSNAVAANSTRLFGWRNIFIAAGLAFIVPYFVRRLLPLFSGDAADVSARDVNLAGKDAVRDAADDLGVGGVEGKLSRGVDRVADRLTH